MTPEETATVLAKCAAVDRRTVGRADVLAWHEILGHLELGVALEAVKRWYTNHREWIMPSDVVELGGEIIRERRKAERERVEARQLAIEQADPTRRDRSHGVAELVSQMRTMLPEGDSDKLRWGHRHWRQVRRQRERMERAEPNPHYDPAVQAALLAHSVHDVPATPADAARLDARRLGESEDR